MSRYEVFMEVLQISYYFASIGLFAGIIIAICQLKVMNKDFRTKNKRASIEKSIEYLNWFATEFIPEYDEYQMKLAGKKINDYPDIADRSFVFNDELNLQSKNIINSLRHKHSSGALNLCNQLEFFSAAMMSGLADEELAFNPLAELFCRVVEFNYDVYCFSRENKPDTLFSHTIELYKMWKERLESLNLEKQKQKIEEKMSKMDSRRVKIIGND